MNVKEFKIENTGGNIYVAWGSFEDGNYFAMGSEILLVYDEDEYIAMDREDYDGYTWQQQHCIDSYNYDSKEYDEVLMQIYNKCNDSYKYMYDLFMELNKKESE